jgi:NADP-dependent aldehyde dehydrogenase
MDSVANSAKAAAATMARLDSKVIAAGLRAAADALDGRAEELAELADRETALGTPRLVGEVARTTGQLWLFADVVEQGRHFERKVSELPEGAPARTLHKINIPLGVVAVFAASNFPFAFSVAGGDTASALAAGNSVIVKAHHGHPQTSMQVGRIVSEALVGAGCPTGTLQVIHGGDAVGRALVLHHDVAAVGFTGSTVGGRALSDIAASREDPIPVFAEQGSINPVVIAPTAFGDAERVGRQFAASVLAGHGQFCTKPGVLLVPDSHADDLVEILRREMTAPAEMYLLTDKIHSQFTAKIDELRSAHAVDIWISEFSPGGYSVPAMLAVADLATYLSTPALSEEIFGPAVVVVRLSGITELKRAIQSFTGNLTATVHGDPADEWVKLATERMAQRVGRMVYGGVPTGVAVDRAMHHGGPYPSSSSSLYTSVGEDAIKRFVRPIAYQDFPDDLLPVAARA